MEIDGRSGICRQKSRCRLQTVLLARKIAKPDRIQFGQRNKKRTEISGVVGDLLSRLFGQGKSHPRSGLRIAGL